MRQTRLSQYGAGVPLDVPEGPGEWELVDVGPDGGATWERSDGHTLDVRQGRGSLPGMMYLRTNGTRRSYDDCWREKALTNALRYMIANDLEAEIDVVELEESGSLEAVA